MARKPEPTEPYSYVSLQVVNPDTGEIAASFPGDYSAVAIHLCDRCAKPGECWEVLEIKTIYRRDLKGNTQ